MSHEEILKQLQEIEDAEGRITPKQIVNAARPEDSPLHGLFEWRDDIAAEQHRLNQARTLLRTVRIDWQINEKKISSIAYLRDPALPPRVQGYRAVQMLRSDSASAEEAVLYEFHRAEAFVRRARDAAYILGCAPQIEALLDQMREIVAIVGHNGGGGNGNHEAV